MPNDFPGERDTNVMIIKCFFLKRNVQPLGLNVQPLGLSSIKKSPVMIDKIVSIKICYLSPGLNLKSQIFHQYLPF